MIVRYIGRTPVVVAQRVMLEGETREMSGSALVLALEEYGDVFEVLGQPAIETPPSEEPAEESAEESEDSEAEATPEDAQPETTDETPDEPTYRRRRRK
jgi:hypothetical protein